MPFKTARVLVAAEQTPAVVDKLRALPEVATTWTIDSFVPIDQEKKLEAIENAKKSLEPALRAAPRPSPSDAENVTALQQGVHALEGIAGQQGTGANAARRLADTMQRLSQAGQPQRARATDAFIVPLQLDLDDIGQSLMAERVTRETLPADLVRDWVAADGRMRIEVWPKGNANDNATVRRFAQAVLGVEPGATGEAIESIEWGATIVEAFIEATASRCEFTMDQIFGRDSKEACSARRVCIPVLALVPRTKGGNDAQGGIRGRGCGVGRAERVRSLCAKHGSNQRGNPQGRDHQE